MDDAKTRATHLRTGRANVPLLLLALLALAPVLPERAAGPGPGSGTTSRCLPCAAVAGAAAGGGLHAQALDERIGEAIGLSAATGAVLAVVHADSIIFLQAFGHTDAARSAEMPLDNLFHLGPFGEALLGALAVRMAREGLVRLDAPVSSYAPDLPPRIGEASLAQLLTYTAGLDDSPLLPRLPGEDPEVLPPERELELLTDRIRLAPPGVVRSRSRFSPLIAGHVLEVAGGRPFAELIEERLVAPAGMVRTVFDGDAAAALGTAPGYVRSSSAAHPFEPAAATPNALLAPHLRAWSSGPDLARLLGAWLGGLSSPEAISGVAEAVHLAAMPLVPDQEDPSPAEGFGIGWQLSEMEGRPELRAFGGGTGHSVLIRVLPELQLGVVVLTNGGGASLFNVSSFILERVAPLFEPEPAGAGTEAEAAAAAPPAEPGSPGGIFPASIVVPLEPVEALGPEHAGTYRNGSEILVLVEEEGELRADMGTARTLEIRSREEGIHTVHIADGRQTMRIRLLRDGDGQVYLLMGGRAFLLEP